VTGETFWISRSPNKRVFECPIKSYHSNAVYENSKTQHRSIKEATKHNSIEGSIIFLDFKFRVFINLVELLLGFSATKLLSLIPPSLRFLEIEHRIQEYKNRSKDNISYKNKENILQDILQILVFSSLTLLFFGS